MQNDVDTRFAQINRKRLPLKRGEGLQIAPSYRVLLNQTNKATVKTRRYELCAKGAAFAQGAYLDVSDQAKTQARQSRTT